MRRSTAYTAWVSWLATSNRYGFFLEVLIRIRVATVLLRSEPETRSYRVVYENGKVLRVRFAKRLAVPE